MSTIDRLLLRLATRKKSLGRGLMEATALTMIATAPRALLLPVLGDHSPFTLYFFSIFLTAAAAGGRAALFALMLSSLIGLFWFVEPVGYLPAGNEVYLRFALFVLVSSLLIISVLAMRRSLVTANEAREREQILAREMGHRVKNLLAVVQSVVAQTGRNSPDLPTFRAALEQRLTALGAAQEIALSRTELPVSRAVAAAAAPFQDQRIKLDVREDCLLAPSAGQALVLALHELITNAMKYGALTAVGGRVMLQVDACSQSKARIVWVESAGPPVSQSRREGFGTRLIRHAIASEGGSVDLLHHRDGLRCELVLPASFSM